MKKLFQNIMIIPIRLIQQFQIHNITFCCQTGIRNDYFDIEQIGKLDGDEDNGFLFLNYQCATGIKLTEQENG